MNPRTACFPLPLRLEAAGMHAGRRQWTLAAPFRAVTSLGVLDIPAGFVTDLTSTPRALWAVLAPADEYLEAAIPHDWLYSPANDRFTRAQADALMLELMHNLGVGWLRRGAIFRALRLFGWRYYRGRKP